MLNKIHHCRWEELLPQIPDHSVDVVLTDPPFGMNYQFAGGRDYQVLEGDGKPFDYSKFGAECHRILKPDTCIFACTHWSTYPKHFKQLGRAGFEMKEPLICQRQLGSPGDLKGTFHSNSSWWMFGHKGRFTFRETRLMRNTTAGQVARDVKAGRKGKTTAAFKTRFPSCWFGPKFPDASESVSIKSLHQIKHPTVKTIKLMQWLILLTTDSNGVVLDPFLGSGTTAVAAKLLKRQYVGCEVDPKYFKLCQRRLDGVPRTLL